MNTRIDPETLVEFWKKQMERGDFWRPFMDQGIAAWAELMARGPISPDLAGQWKQFLDEWIAAWGKVLEQAMGTEVFAQALGRYLDQWVSLQAPAQKAADDFVQALGMPSRAQLSNLARQISDLEERIETLSDQMNSNKQSKVRRRAKARKGR